MKNQIIFKLWIFILSVSFALPACSNSTDDDDGGGTEEPKEKYMEVTYQSSSKVITNPERGFYTHKEFSTEGNDNGTLTEKTIKEYRDKNISLFLTIYYMQDFRDKAISNEFLQRIKTNMEALRAGGGKSVLRFAYTSDETDTPCDAPWTITQQHITQLKPILQEYSDVICVMEAGFIGAWGEWYYTDNYVFDPETNEDYQPRKRVIEALLDALPKDRMVLVRTPAAKLRSMGISLSDTITLDKAYNQSVLSRIGAHNDCFLADSDDRGTYSGNRDFRRFWQYDTRYTAMGGETCSPSNYSECSKALIELEKYHWSYINTDYHGQVINDWIVNGCIDEIKKRLGYRFTLSDGTFSNGGEAGNPFEVKLNLKNTGWASPFNPRNVEIIFISQNNKAEKYKLKLKDDPRFWFPGQKISIDMKFKLPESMPAGNYDMYLNLPDPSSNLANRPEYSIQLANENTWDSETGYNKIHAVEVKKAKSIESFSGDSLSKF